MQIGKLVFLVVLCAGGYYIAHNNGWLDGTVLSLHPAAEIRFEELSAEFAEKDLLSSYAKLGWECLDEKTKMGDRSCWAPIRSWNGICAKYPAFFLPVAIGCAWLRFR